MPFDKSTSGDLSIILCHLTALAEEAKLLLLQHREMTESNLSDLNQRRDSKKLDRLNKETARLRLSVQKSKAAEKRRRKLDMERKRLRKSFS